MRKEQTPEDKNMREQNHVPQRDKKRYQRPTLDSLGDLRDITLGPSLGTGESGDPTIFRA